jgi:MYXO-CTERM domain-containing protein
MPAARLILPGAALMLAGLIAPSLAYAGNGVHPRTPVLWEPAPACMTVVDRTVDANLVLTYTIPYEDTDVTADEVADSRRHQFIAFCRGHTPQVPMPMWLSNADVAAAEAKSLIEPVDVDPEDVFETSTEWKDCMFRITADDARRPITFAEAMKPVVWDTTMLPVGPYVVAGYTWEPVFNIWSERTGVVKVMDDPDPTKNPPALALTNGEEIAFSNGVIKLVGCLDAMDGSTISGYWSLTDMLEAPEWQMFASDVPVSGDSIELDFIPPPESVGESIVIKVEVTDPMDRRFTAHLSALASILPLPDETTGGGCPESGGANFIGNPGCDSNTSGDDPTSAGPGSSGSGPDASSSGGAGSSGVASDSTGPAEQPGKDGGCACGVTGTGEAPVAALLGLGLLLRRRRSR